jgi:hypothetical protein
MSYMRFISTDERQITLAELDAALKQITAQGSVNPTPPGDYYADIEVDGDVHAELEINLPGDDIFKEEIEDLVEPIEWYGDTPHKARVLKTLEDAKWIACFLLLQPGWENDIVDKLCDWLLKNRNGLLEIDGEGYFDLDNIVLEF